MMRGGHLAARHRSAAVPPGDVRSLEELVRTVAALDGSRAAAVLSGLSERLRPSALGILRRLERCSRADRHARLASAFAAQTAVVASAEGIPGELGAEVRRRLAAGVTSGEAAGAGARARWARRLVLELAAP